MSGISDKAEAIKNSLERYGVKNPFLIAGILGVVYKESGFNLKPELSYSGTSNTRLRKIFPTKLGKKTDTELDALKKDNIKFYDAIYGGMYGNTAPGDGWKYRGRGYNGVTFKDLYKIIGDTIGVDLVKNPELVNDPQIASDSLAVYFRNTLKSGEKSGYLKQKIGVDSLADIKDLETGVKTSVQANAGWKTNFNNTIIQEGFKKALAIAPQFYPVTLLPGAVIPEIVKIFTPATDKKKRLRNNILIGAGILTLGGIGYGIYRYTKK